MKKISFDKISLNENSKPFIVAEIGINFNGDLDLAKKTILEAKKSGADSVKFQYYKTEDFISNKKIKIKYQNKSLTQYHLFKKNEINLNQLYDLKKFSDKNKIHFHATPTSEKGINELEEIGINLIKNGSDFLTNTKILKCLSKKKLPVILSTGMSTFKEIEYALSFFKSYKKNNLILLHCVSNYPSKINEANVLRINSIKKKFKTLIGYSDHTLGKESAIIARVYGSIWFEKHFTLSKNLKGPDHHFSSDPKGFKEYCLDIRNVTKIIGTGDINFSKNEKSAKKNYGISCVAKKDLEIGTKLLNSDIDFKRPGSGFKPYEIKKILNKKLKKKIKKDQIITLGHFKK